MSTGTPCVNSGRLLAFGANKLPPWRDFFSQLRYGDANKFARTAMAKWDAKLQNAVLLFTPGPEGERVPTCHGHGIFTCVCRRQRLLSAWSPNGGLPTLAAPICDAFDCSPTIARRASSRTSLSPSSQTHKVSPFNASKVAHSNNINYLSHSCKGFA